MNKRIANPFIVNFMPPDQKGGLVSSNGRRTYVPVNVKWPNFTTAMAPIQSDAYDSVIVHLSGNIPMDQPGIVKGLDIKLNQICKMATQADKAVLNDATKETWYWMNPSYEEQNKAHGYAPGDEEILKKFHTFETELAWQAHQAQVWSRMADMMPLSDGSYAGAPNHIKQLTDPKRGLEPNDLNEFWSFRSGKLLSPSLMGDDMIGMPGVLGNEYDGFSIVRSAGGAVGKETPLQVRSLKTVGMSGIAIPMCNVEGNSPKYQIATDPSKINVALKARTADGVSIQKSEYFDKRRNVFKFQQDGMPCNLRVENATNDGVITFSDNRGTFQARMKEDVKGVLEQRGYELPGLIASLKVEPNAKYIWQSKGTMAGTEETFKTVSPSNAGFVMAREPKNGKEDYVVLVAEGALKGRIVAKYADVRDREGNSFGDHIAKDSGIIVAQVPGVSNAFVESVKPIYDAYPVKGTYIAMDADGRENLAVCRGIHSAYHCLAEKNPVKVLSWNPEQKGLDDALLAVAQDKITLKEMGMHFGSPEKLFPMEHATAPNPYRLDGTRANRQEWQEEYTKDRKVTDARIKALQQETIRRAAEEAGKGNGLADTIKNGGNDLAEALKQEEGQGEGISQ